MKIHALRDLKDQNTLQTFVPHSSLGHQEEKIVSTGKVYAMNHVETCL